MKITIFLKILNFILFIIYCVGLSLFNFKTIWFSFFITLLSIPILIKSAYFVQDSKLWLGTFLLFSGILGFYKTFYNLPLKLIYPMYILIFGLSSFIVFAIFRQNIHLKVFVICLLEVILLGIYKFAYVNLMEFLFIQIALIIFVVTSLLIRAKINTRSN